MLIGNRKIGINHPPFIIAEMSGNHNGSLQRALEIVDAAAECGADAIKLQTYTADSMTIDCDREDFKINDPNSLWNGRTLYSLYEEAHTPRDWHYEIFNRAKAKGILYLSSPFDLDSIDFLDNLNVCAFKIASFENNHIPLIQKAAKTGKPLIISTGMSSLSDIETAVSAAKKANCKDILLLKCTSSYPASPLDSNLKLISEYSKLFNTKVGLSDHTLGIGASLAGVALGAVAIEKHFTLDKKDGGVDSAFSLNPDELKILKKESITAWEAVGKIKFELSESEFKSMQFKRSIYVVEDIKKGEKFNENNIKIIRPGFGAHPKYYEKILGKHSNADFKRGTPLKIENLI